MLVRDFFHTVLTAILQFMYDNNVILMLINLPCIVIPGVPQKKRNPYRISKYPNSFKTQYF